MGIGFKDVAISVGIAFAGIAGCNALKDDSFCTREANYDLVRDDGKGNRSILGNNWITNESGSQCYFVQSQSAPPETLPFKQTVPGLDR